MDFDQNTYTSCIRIGRNPIIPPLMTDEIRSKMRYFRDLAVSRTRHQKLNRPSIHSGVMVNGCHNSINKEDTVSSNIQSTTTSDELIEEEQLLNSCENRRNSYTLECPSPAMIEYLLSLSDNSQIHATSNVSDEASNESKEADSEIDEHYENQFEIVPNNVQSEIMIHTDNLTLEDLETSSRRDSCTPINYYVDIQQHASTPNLKKFMHFNENNRSNSLPNTCQASPIHPVKQYSSNEYLRFDSNPKSIDKKTHDREINYQNTDLEKSKCILDNGNLEANGTFEYTNDSFKYLNGSNDREASRGSVYSDCSSVSLSKFFSDKKVLENDDVKELSPSFQHVKEQLEQKHKAELMKLLQEQQKEVALFQQVLGSLSESSYSSPKSNYVYSKDIVLKKYSVENSPTPMFNQPLVGDSSSAILDKSISCRRRIYDNGPKDESCGEIVKLPVQNEIKDISSTKYSDLESKIRAVTKINAVVRGFLVRRLFRTSRVECLLQTINECLMTAISLQNENYLTSEDLNLQHRVLQQSIAACNEVQTIFSLPVKERMEIIGVDREQKNRLTPKVRTPLPLTEATKKTLQRRKSMNFSSQVQHDETRQRSKSTSNCKAKSTSYQITPSSPKKINKKASSISQKCSISQCTRQSRKIWL